MDFVSSSEQQFVKRLIDIIDANLHNAKFGVNELATELGMSRITLHRKVKSVVNKSVSKFIREARLERAKELLRQKAGTVSEIAYKVGFGSVTYFDRCYHNYYGYPPGESLKGLHKPVENVPIETKKTFIHRFSISKNYYVAVIIVLVTVIIVMFINYHLTE